jgi:hypothetical protein
MQWLEKSFGHWGIFEKDWKFFYQSAILEKKKTGKIKLATNTLVNRISTLVIIECRYD